MTSAHTTTKSTRRPHRSPRAIGMIGGVSFLALGSWAMIAPESFFDALAAFEPYNQHLVQDIGAFQIGLGAVLLLAAIPARPDALTVGLIGVGIGSAAHTVSHIVGIDLGGKPEVDIPFSIAITVLLLAGGLVRGRDQRANDLAPSARRG